MVYFILGFSIMLNIVLILFIIFALKFYKKTKTNFVGNFFEGMNDFLNDSHDLKNDDSVVDKDLAKDFFSR